MSGVDLEVQEMVCLIIEGILGMKRPAGKSNAEVIADVEDRLPALSKGAHIAAFGIASYVSFQLTKAQPQ